MTITFYFSIEFDLDLQLFDSVGTVASYKQSDSAGLKVFREARLLAFVSCYNDSRV